MSKIRFTQEQIEKLKLNPYVKNVSEKGITYTKEFMEDVAIRLSTGMNSTEIMKELGFDIDVIGTSRAYNAINRVSNRINSNKGFEDARKAHSGRPRKTELTVEDENEMLKQKILILEQENSFLKKMKFLVKKATWLKSLQKKDTK